MSNMTNSYLAVSGRKYLRSEEQSKTSALVMVAMTPMLAQHRIKYKLTCASELATTPLRVEKSMAFPRSLLHPWSFPPCELFGTTPYPLLEGKFVS
eukprot:363049-Chlamydomonas_euryale.AAC.25